jgi:hypothetical protein
MAMNIKDAASISLLPAKTIRSTLKYLIESCHGDHRPDCPILDDLAGTSAVEALTAPDDPYKWAMEDSA